MRARAGRIVNIASVVGLRANPGQSNYGAAKAGLIAVHAHGGGRGRPARDHDQRGRAGIHRHRHDGRAEQRDLLNAMPAKRAGTPEEVAACVRFLVSQQAGYVTGAVLTVDGGLAA